MNIATELFRESTMGPVTKQVSCGACNGAGTTEYKYDGAGRVTLVRQGAASNAATYFYYNEIGVQTHVKSPVGDGTSFANTYSYPDMRGNVTKVIDPLGKHSYFRFDSEDRLTKVTDPLSHNTT